MVAKLTITALHCAIKECRLKPVEDSLQQFGIPKATKKTTDYVLLQTAVDKNHKNIAKLLINAGCRIKPNESEKDNGWTPLALAIIRGNLETAMLLLNKGAGPEAGNKTGLTVLHLAIRKKSLDMLRILLCHMSVNLVDGKGQTLLQTFFHVISNQVNPDQLDLANNIKILDVLLAKGASLDLANDAFGYTALHYAIKSRQVGLITRIIQKIGNVNVTSHSGDTPLHVLLSDKYSNRRGVLDIVKLLVRSGADVNIVNNQNETLFHVILSRCHGNEEEVFETIQFLTERGANVNTQNYRSESACHIAARKKFLRVLNLFLRRQIQINLQDYEDNTVFHRLLQNSAGFRLNDDYVEMANAFFELRPALEVRNTEGRTLFDLIIQNKQTRLLGRVLTENVNMNAVDENGNTVLHKYLIDLKEKNYRIDESYVELVEVLSTNGANVDLVNNDNKSPVQLVLDLQKSETNKRTQIFNLLIPLLNRSNDLDRIIEDKRKTILHVMCQLKRPFDEAEDTKAAEIVDICLRRGATIELMDQQELTPLCTAVKNRQRQVVRVLLEHDADPDQFIGQSQVSVLEYLLRLERHTTVDVEIAGLILSRGAAIDIDIDQSPDSEYSILRYVMTNKFEMCSKLVAHSLDVDVIDDLGNTALHNLLRSRTDADEDKVCKIATELILKGDLINVKNDEGLTPLHLTVGQKLRKVVALLLEYHADATARDEMGNCALHYLALKPDSAKDLKMIRMLIKNGCDVNTRNNNGVTPLLKATQIDNVGLVKALIRYRGDVNLCSNEFSAPLHLATERGHAMITKYLIKYGADVNARKMDGRTALHVAVVLERFSSFDMLMKNGADVDMRDAEGRTAISLACVLSKIEMVRRLLKNGADVNLVDNEGKVPIQGCRGQVQMEISTHIKKLNAAGMFVSDANLRRVNIANDPLNGEFEKEVTKLRETKIDSQKSLLDVLLMSQSRLASFKNNGEFQRQINDEELHQQFPHYADLLKACYARGEMRSDLLGQAKIFFRDMIELPMPDVCCDLIFGFLGNESLQDLVTAGRLNCKTRKRRRDDYDDEDDEEGGAAAPPAKRVRRVSV